MRKTDARYFPTGFGATITGPARPNRAAAPQAEEDRQPFVDRNGFFLRKFTEDAPDPPLVHGPQMVDQRERLLRDAARTGREHRIQEPLARCPSQDEAAGTTHTRGKRRSLMMSGSLTTTQGLVSCCS